MALSPQEQQILDYAKANGKTPVEAKLAIAKYRQSQPQTTAGAPRQSIFERVTGAAKKATDFLGMSSATDVLGKAVARTSLGAKLSGTDVEANREFIEPQSTSKLIGAGIQAGVTAASPLIPASLPLKSAIAAGVGAGYAFDIGQDLASGSSVSETITPGVGAVAGVAGPLAGPAGKATAKAAKEGVEVATKAVTNSPVVKGALQSGIELAERVPRFVSKKNVALRDAASRADRIATAPAPIGNAIKAGVDERIINTIEQADPVTRSGYRDIVRLAEESVSTTGTIKNPARPEIVAGEAAAQQYKLIDDQRKKVGQAIGEQTRALSRDVQVPMQQSYAELSEALSEIGVQVTETKAGKVLNFGRTGFTKAQRAKINELFELATEGGDSLSPAEIHAKDRLFSQLQRETRMEGIGDIIIDSPEGPVSLFRVFRDVYAQNLENLSPELRRLNSQYRNLSTFTEDIENTIIKGGKYETNSSLDPAEFAQTNLRRLFSEAQSAADYRAIADEMDNASRALGYQGAKPEDLARFAYEIRKIYPETTPRTGIEGTMRTTIGGMVDAVMGAGKPDLEDQQKALRELFEAIENLPQQTE